MLRKVGGGGVGVCVVFALVCSLICSEGPGRVEAKEGGRREGRERSGGVKDLVVYSLWRLLRRREGGGAGAVLDRL